MQAGGILAGSVLDRSGFTGEKPVNKDIRFPSDVCSCRAFVRFCGKEFLRRMQEEAGALCPAIVFIVLC